MWLVVKFPSGEVEFSKEIFTTSLCHIGLANQATILSQTCTNTRSVLSSRHTLDRPPAFIAHTALFSSNSELVHVVIESFFIVHSVAK